MTKTQMIADILRSCAGANDNRTAPHPQCQEIVTLQAPITFNAPVTFNGPVNVILSRRSAGKPAP